MQEVCCYYCHRLGDVDDRQPIWGEDRSEALRCPQCGHLDSLALFNDDARQVVFEAAVGKWLAGLEERIRSGHPAAEAPI